MKHPNNHRRRYLRQAAILLILGWAGLFVRKGPLWAASPPPKAPAKAASLAPKAPQSAPARPSEPETQSAVRSAMPLSHEEQLELQNLQLQLKDLQNEAQLKVMSLRSMVQQYEANTLKAHPGEPFHLDYNILQWVHNPQEKKGTSK